MAANDNQALLLQVSADIRGLEKAFDRAAGVVKKRSKEMEDSGSRLEKFFGKPSLSKGIDKVFDSTRFKILDTGAARVGLFGSALESLGPIGLTVAGVLGAVGVAAHQALQAMAFGDEIGDTAAKLQVTTKTLQEYRYAIHAAGGETTDADAAIGSFTETLGRAEAGLPKALKWFKALGFTQEQLKSFSSTDEAIQAVMERIGKLPDASQRAAAAAAVGLTGMIPAINQGIDKFDELRAAAHRLGYVLDNDTIQKLSDAKDRMEDASHIIKVQLAAAFSDTAVDIARAATALADWIAQLRRVSQEAPGLFQAMAAAAQINLNPAGAVRSGIAAFDAFKHRGQDRADARAGPVTADQMRSYFGLPAPGLGQGGNLELPGKDNSAAEARKALERRRASDAAIDAAQKDELAARAALTDSISEQLAFKLQEIEAERAHKNDQLDYQAQLKTITNEAAEQAKAINDQTAVEQAMLATREAALKLEQDALAQRQAVDRYYQEISDIEASMARTVKERYRIELKNLEHVQKLERDELKTQLDAEVTSGKRSQSSADELLAAQADAQSAQRRKLAHDNQGPFADYIDKLPQSIDEVNERMQDLAVEGIEGLNNAIVDLATGAGDASDILRNLVRQMLADFTRLELQQIEGSIFKGKSGGNFLSAALSFGASLFSGASGASLSASAASMNATNAALVAAGLADGGMIFGPGGPRDDRIPIWASSGEFMVNADATKKHRALLEAINGGRPLPRYANGGIVDYVRPQLSASNIRHGDINVHVSVAAAEPHRIDARRTAMQTASILGQQIAIARKRGL